jgi:hypothetical protein
VEAKTRADAIQKELTVVKDEIQKLARKEENCKASFKCARRMNRWLSLQGNKPNR